MTKKDYELIAEAIRTMTFPLINADRKDYHKIHRGAVADKIAGALKFENERFDYDKFENYIFPGGRYGSEAV